MKVKTDKTIIERILNKAVEEIFPSKKELEKKLTSGERLKVYQGFDPTAPTLHIGHSVVMRKLEDFRKLGHEVYFLIGDFTAMVGDPSDKLATRKKLTREEILENLKLYKQQAAKIIDVENKENPIKLVFNYDWLSKLTFEEIIEISSHFTVQQMIKRDMFQKRLEQNKPIYLNEFLYPLMQGYDSIQLDVDIEVCGNDQTFNALAGRHLSKEILNKNKFVIAGKLLTTTDGKKMGKSEGNMIKLNDTPNDIYGKIMAFPDEAITSGFELITNAGMKEVEKYKTQLKDKNFNPMVLKKQLAYEVTKDIHTEEDAEKAQTYFENVFQKKDFNTKLEEIYVDEESLDIITLVHKTNLAQSKSAIRRLIEQGAISIDNRKIAELTYMVKLNQPVTLKIGKKIVKIIKN